MSKRCYSTDRDETMTVVLTEYIIHGVLLRKMTCKEHVQTQNSYRNSSSNLPFLDGCVGKQRVAQNVKNLLENDARQCL